MIATLEDTNIDGFFSERGPDKKVQIGEKCQVCHEQATGFNYGALTCNPCKSFFRRTILENNLTQVKLGKTLLYMLRNKYDIY